MLSALSPGIAVAFGRSATLSPGWNFAGCDFPIDDLFGVFKKDFAKLFGSHTFEDVVLGVGFRIPIQSDDVGLIVESDGETIV